MNKPDRRGFALEAPNSGNRSEILEVVSKQDSVPANGEFKLVVVGRVKHICVPRRYNVVAVRNHANGYFNRDTFV